MPGPRLYVARLEPYRISDLDRLLAALRKNPLVRITPIGKTVGAIVMALGPAVSGMILELPKQAAAGPSENELLAAARLASQKKLEEGRQKSQGEMDAARSDLSKERQVLARDVATRVLGREVNG